MVFCPPFVFLEPVAAMLKMSHLEHESFLGAQDLAVQNNISLTGEVPGEMLAKLGVSHVIIGHSERRWKLGESDAVVNQKLKEALKCELIPIVCIGEKSREGDYKQFIENQILGTFNGLTADQVAKCIIAYEPVWAISTNPDAKSDTPPGAVESINMIQGVLSSKFQALSPRFIYGGSVTSQNISDFLKPKEVDGVLIGGASVDKEKFVEILKRVVNV